jgi:hypothetical protein
MRNTLQKNTIWLRLARLYMQQCTTLISLFDVPDVAVSMHTTMVYEGRGETSLILNLRTRYRWVVYFTPWPLYPIPIQQAFGPGPTDAVDGFRWDKNTLAFTGIRKPDLQSLAIRYADFFVCSRYFILSWLYLLPFTVQHWHLYPGGIRTRNPSKRSAADSRPLGSVTEVTRILYLQHVRYSYLDQMIQGHI